MNLVASDFSVPEALRTPPAARSRAAGRLEDQISECARQRCCARSRGAGSPRCLRRSCRCCRPVRRVRTAIASAGSCPPSRARSGRFRRVVRDGTSGRELGDQFEDPLASTRSRSIDQGRPASRDAPCFLAATNGVPGRSGYAVVGSSGGTCRSVPRDFAHPYDLIGHGASPLSHRPGTGVQIHGLLRRRGIGMDVDAYPLDAHAFRCRAS